jgi:hypothetical protein
MTEEVKKAEVKPKQTRGKKARRMDGSHKRKNAAKPKPKKVKKVSKTPIPKAEQTNNLVQDLAKTILKEQTEKKERKAQKNYEAAITSEVVESTDRVVLTEGLSIHDPIIVNNHEREVFRHIDRLFGRADGSYTVLGERTNTQFIRQIQARRRLKFVMLEDKNSHRYVIIFDVSALSLVH